MFDRNDSRTVTVLVDEVLSALRTNLEEHKEIVEEAKDGYLDKAQAALDKKIAQLRDGKLVALIFSLQPPKDHSKEFKTAIKMLELHKDAHEATGARGPATFELKAADVQRLVLNDWSWMESFLSTSSDYSGKAAALFAERA